jgi:hypothetical protein
MQRRVTPEKVKRLLQADKPNIEGALLGKLPDTKIVAERTRG